MGYGDAMRHWPWAVPTASALLLGVGLVAPASVVLTVLLGVALIASVLAAVHHAEVVAHRLGEPLGTLVLAVAVTVIEVALLVSLMLGKRAESAALARDTVFAAIMIICNGVVGICVLVGGLKHREQVFRVEGAKPALATLVAMCGLSLVLPTFTTSSHGPTYTASQLIFAAASSLVLWAVFVFIQTVRHRDYFLPMQRPEDEENEEIHAEPPSVRATWISLGLLLVGLVSVVGLAKLLSPSIEAAVDAAGAPKAVVGVAIALLVLLPETWAAVRAARANRLQASMNLALGSGLASIGLTMPAIAVVSLVAGLPLTLGLGSKDLVLLILTFMVGTLTVSGGRTTIMQGALHLALFGAFLFLAFVP